MLELVSGPTTRSIPFALSEVSFSSATTGLVAESSETILSCHGSPLSSRYLLNCCSPNFEPSQFSWPLCARSPVSGRISPIVTSPESPDPSSTTASSTAGASGMPSSAGTT